MFYEEAFRELNRQKVKYVVAGGIAVNLHGVPRVTEDLDLVIYLGEENINKFSKAMETLGYKPKIPVKIEDFGVKKNRESWIKDKGMIVFSLWNKEMAGRKQDVSDIVSLRRVKKLRMK